MSLRTSLLVATLAALPVAAPLGAQATASIGTAAGLGTAAMTEARQAEAALWNPALAGIFDGPISSVSLLGFSVEPGAVPVLPSIARLGYGLRGDTTISLTPAVRSALGDWPGAGSAARYRGEGTVQWVGVHSRSLLLSLSSHGYQHARLPSRAARIAAGDEDALFSAIAQEEHAAALDLRSHRGAYTVLAVAKASDLGLLPLFGRTWVGVTGKGALVHDHAYGEVSMAPAAALLAAHGMALPAGARAEAGQLGALYQERGVGRARIYGVDVGIVSHPLNPVLFSLAFANVYQYASLDQGVAYERTVVFGGTDTEGQPLAQSRYVRSEAIDDEVRLRSIEDLARRTHFLPVLRAGASLDTNMGRFLVGGALPMEREDAIDRYAHDRYSLAFQADGPSRGRISYSRRFDDSRKVAIALQSGTCEGRMTFEAGYLQVPDASPSFTIGASWSRGFAPCGLFR
jgi:hypothetical protein